MILGHRRLGKLCAGAIAVFAVACGGSEEHGTGGAGGGAGGNTTQSGGGGASADEGQLSYVLDGVPYLQQARDGGAVTDVSAALDVLGPRPATNPLPETGIDPSPDGAWIVVVTERFDAGCDGWACAAVVPRDFSQAEAVTAGGSLVHPMEVAIGSGGDLLVFVDDNRALWAARRQAGVWGDPLELSASSTYAYAWRPAVSDDGQHVLFDCGDELFPATAICEVAIDGTGFRLVRTRDQGPPAHPSGPGVHHADYAPDGSIVFEAEYADGEQVWRLRPGAADPELVAASYTNDNSPCVLPDGRIASLWLNRPGSAGGHELKVMAPDGSDHFMARLDVDVADVGLGCGR